MRRGKDRGAAAVELALCLSLLMVLGALVFPVPAALVEQTRLQEAANRTVRWASSAPRSTRPQFTATQVQAEVESAVRAATGDTQGLVLPPPTFQRGVSAPQCAGGRAAVVVLEKAVDLGPLYAFADAVLLGNQNRPTVLTASATACQE